MRALDSGQKDAIRQEAAERLGDETSAADLLIGSLEAVVYQESRSKTDQQRAVEVGGTISTLAKL